MELPCPTPSAAAHMTRRPKSSRSTSAPPEKYGAGGHYLPEAHLVLARRRAMAAGEIARAWDIISGMGPQQTNLAIAAAAGLQMNQETKASSAEDRETAATLAQTAAADVRHEIKQIASRPKRPSPPIVARETDEQQGGLASRASDRGRTGRFPPPRKNQATGLYSWDPGDRSGYYHGESGGNRGLDIPRNIKYRSRSSKKGESVDHDESEPTNRGLEDENKR